MEQDRAQTFGELLKQLRRDAEGVDGRGNPVLTQHALGLRVGVREKSIARWESGQNLPDAVTFLRLAVALGADLERFLPLVEGGAQTERPTPAQEPTGAGLDELAEMAAEEQPKRQPRRARRKAG